MYQRYNIIVLAQGALFNYKRLFIIKVKFTNICQDFYRKISIAVLIVRLVFVTALLLLLAVFKKALFVIIFDIVVVLLLIVFSASSSS